MMLYLEDRERLFAILGEALEICNRCDVANGNDLPSRLSAQTDMFGDVYNAAKRLWPKSVDHWCSTGEWLIDPPK